MRRLQYRDPLAGGHGIEVGVEGRISDCQNLAVRAESKEPRPVGEILGDGQFKAQVPGAHLVNAITLTGRCQPLAVGAESDPGPVRRRQLLYYSSAGNVPDFNPSTFQRAGGHKMSIGTNCNREDIGIR